MTFYQEIYNLRPWYHDFQHLGLQTDFGDMQSSLFNRLRLALHRGEWLSPKVTLETESPDFLVTSAPGWRHDNRFMRVAVELLYLSGGGLRTL